MHQRGNLFIEKDNNENTLRRCVLFLKCEEGSGILLDVRCSRFEEQELFSSQRRSFTKSSPFIA